MTSGGGRPLRFLALVGCCWVGGRYALIVSATGSLPDAVRAIVPLPGPAIAATAAALPEPSAGPRAGGEVRDDTTGNRYSVVAPKLPAALAGAPVARTVFVRSSAQAGLPEPRITNVAAAAVPFAVDAVGAAQIRDPVRIGETSRLSISTWMIARGGTGPGSVALAPQLGGTQGGIRIDYAVGNGLAATGRIAAPAAGIGREVSLGIAWRPSAIPVRFVVEQRVALDGGKGGPVLGISSGVSAVRLPARFRLDGYAQAGAIARAGIETYADASVRAARPIADLGGIAVDVGAGAWGGAQRGAARLDVGPSIGARIPLAGQALRVALDWRQRVAGNARPGSGPALTLGTDF